MNGHWRRTIVAAALAAGITVSAMPFTSAAIPCIDQPVIDDARDVAISTLVPSGTFTIEDVLAGRHGEVTGTPANATLPAEDVLRDEVAGPIENVVRCVLYGDYGTLATLVTGRYRAEHMAMPSPDDVRHPIAAVDSFRLLTITGTAKPDDDHLAGQVEILLDHDRLLIVTLVFQRSGDFWYLDDSAIQFAGDVDAEATITYSTDGAEPGAVAFPASDITVIGIENKGDEVLEYRLSSLDGNAPLSTGTVFPPGFAGPPDDSVLVLHHLPPGKYALRLTTEGLTLALPQTVEITLT